MRDLLAVLLHVCESIAEASPESRLADLSRVGALAARKALHLVRQDAHPIDLAALEPPPLADRSKVKVLVVDDEPEVLSLMVMAFERAGFTAFSASDGWQALRMLRDLKPDLLVTDIIMPDVEGIRTILTARQETPDCKIIAITGGGAYGRTETLLKWARELGADEVLAKPFRMSALLTAARVTLENRRGHRPMEEFDRRQLV
jgi:CheY-like chemotaxis protein